MAKGLPRAFDETSDILLGDGEGKIKIVWYVDYACRHTRRIRDTVRRSPERLGAHNAAVAVRFIVPLEDRHGSALAARGAAAAHRQGRFAEMHEALFDHPPHYTEEAIAKIAGQIGLDLPRFREDLDAPEIRQKVDDDRAGLGSPENFSMPLIFINDRYYDGAWDEDAIIEAIEQPLGFRLRMASTDFFY